MGKSKKGAHPTEKIFDKKALDIRNAQGFDSHEMVPLKKMKELEKIGEPVSPQVRVVEDGPRFTALPDTRSQVMPLMDNMGETEIPDPLGHVVEVMDDDDNLETNTELNDEEIKTLCVLKAAELALPKRQRSQSMSDVLRDFMRLRISKDRQKRKELERIGIAYGLGAQAARIQDGNGFFDQIKEQFGRFGKK